MRKKTGSNRKLLKTVRNALSLLEAFTPERPKLGITELSRLLRLSKTSVFRLAATLEAAGYLCCDETTGRYALSVRLFELGCVAVASSGIREAAAPFLEHVARVSQETAHLAILDDGQVVYVDKIDSPQPITTNTRLGGRADAYCTATGKVILAFQPESVVASVIERGLRPYTSTTITDPSVLRRQLELVRRTGYAINQAEWREGVVGVAAPVFNHARQAVAAVGVAAPAARASTAHYEKWIELVLRAAAETSTRLGCTRTPPERVEGISDWLASLPVLIHNP